jgi:predicted metal-dependent hydrolase
MTERIRLGDLFIEVLLKDIKNVHLSVLPPNGRVRISAPARMKIDTIRVFAISKLPWIRAQQKKIIEQERETPREYIDRESHYVWGRRYLLKVRTDAGSPGVQLEHRHLVLHVSSGADRDSRQALLARWYRDQIRAVLPELSARWEERVGVQANRILVQKMKTKWGSCNPRHRSIRLNTELAKKPIECLEYIVVHEMVHLLERHHNDRFRELMDRLLPQWRTVRDELNRSPLSHESWEY